VTHKLPEPKIRTADITHAAASAAQRLRSDGLPGKCWCQPMLPHIGAKLIVENAEIRCCHLTIV